MRLILALSFVACGAKPSISSSTSVKTQASAQEGSVSGAIADLHGWHWQDVMNNMGALQAMGFTALQISPHTATCSGAYGGLGYDPSDFTDFSGGFGDSGDLYWLVQTTHNFGMQIYADMVMNHMCTHPDYAYPRFSWNDFHHNGSIQDWSNQWQLENDDLDGLNDLAQESDYVRGELWNYLVQTNNLGFDGYRWDAAKHVPIWFWRDDIVNNTLSWGKYSFGEVDDGDPDYLQSYVDAGMAVTDYTLYYAMQSAFQYGGDLSQLDGAGYAMRNGGAALTFVENDDVGAPANRWLAYGFLAAYPGYPSFHGIALGDHDTTNLVWIHTHKAYGAYLSRWHDHDTLVFERQGNLLAGFNQSGAWRQVGVQTSWSNTQLHDYTGHTGDVWSDGNGYVTLNIPPTSYVMLSP
jgi:alpha-amylase